jgi:trans-aconitate 2-methyltransferase
MTSADYYDDYADRQVRVGINARHRAIQRWLKKFGLVPGMDVLEIGCGVGTQTELIAKTLKGSGSLVAIDLSPRSIDLARQRLVGQSHVQLLAADVLELELDRRFDVIVMPDVIEHIPLEEHIKLFAKVREWLRDTGWVLIHMPNPLYLEWCHRHRPDLLQLVDQPIYTETLVGNIHPNDLYVHYLNTYSVWVPEGDYQVVVLKPRDRSLEFRIGQMKPPLPVRLARVTRQAFRKAAASPRARRKGG